MTESWEIQGEMPIAYSYVRFSTAKQELGDSLRRQVQMAKLYAEQNGLRLSERTFQDLGVSGFKQKNIKTGALSAFILAVKNGFVAPGSYLLIEQFDRLSRAEISVAFRLLLDLVEAGIIVVTLVDERVWNKETVDDITNVLTSVILMSRAHEESKAKSRRLASVWDEKKKHAVETGKILTSECPRWLTVNADKTAFIVLEDRVESIRKVFDLRIGGHGVVSIVNRANKEAWPAPGKGETWHTSLVGRLLKNRALLGEYQPYKHNAKDGTRVPAGDPVPRYYPAVLDEQTFLRAQAVSDRKGEFPGRRDVSYRNWLQGLLKCSCGHSFVRKNKQSAKQPGYARYYCTARNRGLTDCASLGAQEIESAVIHAVSTVAPHFWNGTSRLAELTAQADVQHVELTAAQGKRDRFAEAIGSSNAAIPALLQRLSAAQDEVDAAEKSLAETRAAMAELESDSDTVFENIVKAVRNVDSLDARAELREDLSRVLVKCVVDATAGTVAVYLRGEDVPVTVPLHLNAALPGVEMRLMSLEDHAKLLEEH